MRRSNKISHITANIKRNVDNYSGTYDITLVAVSRNPSLLAVLVLRVKTASITYRADDIYMF